MNQELAITIDHIRATCDAIYDDEGYIASASAHLVRNYPHLFRALRLHAEEWVGVNPNDDLTSLTPWQFYTKGLYVAYGSICMSFGDSRVTLHDSTLNTYEANRFSFVCASNRVKDMEPFFDALSEVTQVYSPESLEAKAFFMGICDVVLPFFLETGQMGVNDL